MFKQKIPFEIKQKIVLTSGAHFKAKQLSRDFFKEVLKDTLVNNIWKPRKSGSILTKVDNTFILNKEELQLL